MSNYMPGINVIGDLTGISRNAQTLAGYLGLAGIQELADCVLSIQDTADNFHELRTRKDAFDVTRIHPSGAPPTAKLFAPYSTTSDAEPNRPRGGREEDLCEEHDAQTSYLMDAAYTIGPGAKSSDTRYQFVNFRD
ncbi:hypothetical protein PV11_03850 [Exophiala sideris]|uniref:Uncharacterized protein n=1 Tax=Exophiala sideris TaxID=1016849 RepID=A0A0D1VZ23_9EURO|nr:hypothetical protein PV11_03850 [Exophiala sideris]